MINISSREVTLLEIIVGSLLIVFSAINIGIFVRLKKSFSIKYELLRDPNFRGRKWLQNLIKALYWIELIIPIILMVILFLSVVARDVKTGFVVLANGFLLLSLIYLTNARTFYYKMGLILFLLVFSQLVTLYLAPEDVKSIMYAASSSIFFSLNGILVSLTIFAKEGIYWDLSEAFKSLKEQIKKVNEGWNKKIPKIVNGGIYGWFNKQNQHHKSQYQISSEGAEAEPLQIQNCCQRICHANHSIWPIVFYVLSLIVLIIYAFQDWWFSGQFIGTITAGAVITFDFAIFVLSSLSQQMRSPFSVMIIIFVIRFFLFIFGNSYWFMGYCLLYILIGTFIAYIIIQKRYPKMKVNEIQQNINALKTPEFIFILITTQLVVMIIALYVTNNKNIRAETFLINGKQFEFWSFGVLSILITLIISLYTASMRVLYRSLNKIRDKIMYYFFDEAITEYHVYMLVTYASVVVLGVYTYFKYESSISLMLCLFLPLIYILLVQMSVCWQENNFRVFADIDQYNKKERRKRKVQKNRRQVMIRLIDNNQLIDKLGRKEKKAFNKMNNIYIDTPAINDHQSSAHDMIDVCKSITQQSQDPHDLVDWRDQKNNIGFPQLFLYITSNDKKLLLFMGLFLVLNVGMIVTSYLWCKSHVGVFISVSLLSYILQISYYRCTKTIHDLRVLEMIGIIGGFLLGLIFWSFFWYQSGGCLAWSIIFILILAYLLVETLRNTKDQKKLYVTQIIQILLLMIFNVLIVYFNFKQIYYIIITCGVMFYFIMGLVFYYLFTYFNKALPRWIYYAFAAIIGSTLLGVIIAAFFVNSISILSTFSIAMLVPISGFIIFGWSQFYYRYFRRYEDVVVYSAYGLPAHRFVSEKQTFKKDEYYLYIYFIALMGLVVYSELIFFFFEGNTNAGIYSLCFFEVVSFISLMLILMKNYYEVGKDKSQITTQILKDTFHLLIDKYMPDIDNDENTGKMEIDLKQLEESVQNNPDDPNINEKYDQIVFKHDTIMHNLQEEEVFLLFWMGLIEFRIISKKRQTMQNLLNIVKEMKTQLENVGISFVFEDESNDLEIRYEMLMNQIATLDPMKLLIFQKIKKQHLEKTEIQKKEADQIDQIERNKNQQRERQLKLKLFAQVSGIKEGYSMTDIDKQKIKEFQDLVKNLQKQNILYEDEEFPADENSLGQKVINKVHSWQRPSQKAEVIKDKIDIKDIKQGQVGDCYLISTLGVLGQEKLRKAMGLPFINKKNQQVGSKWPCDGERGIFMVRFKKFKQNIFVTIDNKFPVDESGQWICGRCEDPNEIWVNIVEKAYAKMYGSYSKIFGGKAHFVMAEFTGGFPSEIILDQFTHNVNALWRKLQSYNENKYIMAAGSPPGSDTTYSKMGIAKGHAYAVLQVRAIQSFKLIQLKNPQGSKSLQWKGDFSDKSPQMDNRMKGLLGHTDESDGIFWMPIVDFVREFKSLYICREFDKNWIKKTFKGQWKKQVNSFGNQKNKNIQKNPQYSITITQKCTLFISLTQQGDGSSITSIGLNKIAFRLQKNNGKRIYYKDVSSQLLCTPAVTPTTNITLSNQYELEEGTYPCTYTLMVFSQDKEDEGPYLVQIYCNDKKCTFVDDADFERPEKQIS